MSTSNIFSNVFIAGTVGGTTITASTQFSGPGTGLTGTAASLTSGLSSGLTGTPNITVGTVGGTTITASTQFSGPGTGLTGTAASFNVGGSAGSLSTTYTAGCILYGAGSGVPTTVSTLFYDSANGRLGLGTTNPGSALEVNGVMRFTGTSTSLPGINLPTGGAGIHWGNGNSRIYDDGDLRISTDDNMHFYTGGNATTPGTERITLLSGGNVGIGTASPTVKLDIAGALKTSTNSTNYVVGTGVAVTINSTTPTTVASASLTTNGKPIFVMCSGDLQPVNGLNDWCYLRLYRDLTAIGNLQIDHPNTNSSSNEVWAIHAIDVPAAGTYTYSCKASQGSGNIQFGEVGVPYITAYEFI